MTHFMAYVILLSAGIGACALAAEFLLRARIGATRWVWVVALGCVLLVTGVVTVTPAPVIAVPDPTASALVVDGITAPPITIVVDELEASAIVQAADATLPIAWGVASLVLLGAIVFGQRRVASARRSAKSLSVNGRDVLLTEDLGPAVAGIRRPVVFLPRWALALDRQSQELMLAHEFEHATRGDTRLLLAGAIAGALMPWNPVVWWITRRMRLAVEQDCDARVLRSHPDVRRYADLLLTAASRPATYAHLLATHFGEQHSDLDRRIRAMTDRTLKWRPLLAVAAVAAGLIVASCEAPRPEPLAPRETGLSAAKSAVPEDVVPDEFQVGKPVVLQPGSAMPKYPEILREAGVEGEVLVWFAVDEQGKANVQSFKVIRATHELFAAAVKQALPSMRFVPAEVGGRKVKQIVEQPFSFSLPKVEPKAEQRKEVAFEEGKRLAYVWSRDQSAAGTWEPKKSPQIIYRTDQSLSEPVNVEILSSRGEVISRLLATTKGFNEIKPDDISSIEVFKPRSCSTTTSTPCPLIKITLKPGRESAYRK